VRAIELASVRVEANIVRKGSSLGVYGMKDILSSTSEVVVCVVGLQDGMVCLQIYSPAGSSLTYQQCSKLSHTCVGGFRIRTSMTVFKGSETEFLGSLHAHGILLDVR
jgi:hypothetical protein